MRVAILGAGLMGAQIACEYALGGHDVVLHARGTDAALARAQAGFEVLRTHGLREHDELRAAAGRIGVDADPSGAAADADLLVESLPEDLELKVAVIRATLAAAPGALLATNTSSIPIGVLGDALGIPERTIGTHYLNPPLLMPPVEVIAGPRTAPETLGFVRDTVAALGKLPVVVRCDVTGFVWNRLQFALVRECAWLVEHGVASAEDIDTVMREGLARRWRTIGPLRSITLGGIETWSRSGRNIVPELSRAEALPDLEQLAITGGDVASDTAARDAALAADLRERRPPR